MSRHPGAGQLSHFSPSTSPFCFLWEEKSVPWPSLMKCSMEPRTWFQAHYNLCVEPTRLLSGKDFAYQSREHRINPWVGKIMTSPPPGLFSQECGPHEVTLALKVLEALLCLMSSHGSPRHISGTISRLISCMGCITDTQDWFLCTQGL